jgi:hypothetical protein
MNKKLCVVNIILAVLVLIMIYLTISQQLVFNKINNYQIVKPSENYSFICTRTDNTQTNESKVYNLNIITDSYYNFVNDKEQVIITYNNSTDYINQQKYEVESFNNPTYTYDDNNNKITVDEDYILLDNDGKQVNPDIVSYVNGDFYQCHIE